MDFWRKAARTSEILEVRSEVIRGKMGVNSVQYGKYGKKCFEMLVTCITRGITRWPKKVNIDPDAGPKKRKWGKGCRKSGEAEETLHLKTQ